MAKKLSSALGVDLGSKFIKIAEVRLQGRTPVVTALGIAETPSGAIDHMGVHDSRAVSGVLKQLIASSGVSVGDAIVSLSGQGSVLVRTLEVPSMNDAELKQHMDWEITRNIPFSESTVVSDYKALAPAAGAQQMDVVMAIAPQSVVDMMVDLVKQSGKKAAAFDVEPLGIARSLTVSYDSEVQGKTVCVVEIGHKTTAINIYRDGKLVMPRQVPVGGEMVTQSIANTLGVSIEEAEGMKVSRGEIPAMGAPAGGTAGGATQAFPAYNPFADPSAAAPAAYNPFAPEPDGSAPAPAPAPAVPDAGAAVNPEVLRLYNAMAPVVDEIVSEVRRSLDYFRSKGGDVDKVLLCGGGSRLRGLDGHLESLLGVPCSLLDPFKEISLNAKKADQSLLDARQDFAVAVGNGLHIAF